MPGSPGPVERKRTLARLQSIEAVKTPAAVRAKRPKKASAPKVSLLQLIETTLDDAKAENIVVVDLDGKSSIADQMVVATGRVDRHVAAIADRVLQELKAKGFPTPRIEGTDANEWVLIDAGDVIVHIFKPEARQFYNIERLWSSDRPRDMIAE